MLLTGHCPCSLFVSLLCFSHLVDFLHLCLYFASAVQFPVARL